MQKNMKTIALVMAITASLIGTAEAKTTWEHRVENGKTIVVEEVIPEVHTISAQDRTQLLCLATAINTEATNSNQDDERAVGSVVMNRAHDPEFGTSPCDVIKRGFSAVHGKGKLVIGDSPRWERNQQIAWNLYFAEEPPRNERTHFYNPKLRLAMGLPRDPQWAKYGYDKKKIGEHIYMKVSEVK
jgi:spore germination cell wall hydrolase CwlJ-like protein